LRKSLPGSDERLSLCRHDEGGDILSVFAA
jgi:hypothetical protein